MDGMNEDPSDDRERRFGTDPRQDWIGEIAESEGISREEVVEQLVSSYWTLKEMHGLMETAEEGIDGGRTELPIDIETLSTGALVDDLEEVHERIERLEAALAEHGKDASAEELQARLQRLMDRLDTFEASVTERYEEIAERQERFAGRLDELSGRFDDEFENLETILEYLVETTDRLDEEIEAVADDHAATSRRHAREDRLIELKHLASRLGVRRAKCEYCDTQVDIALLPTPECPKCDRPFTDIEPDTRWFLGSNVLTVTESRYLDERGRERGDGGRDRPDADAPSEDASERSGGSFVWGDERD